MSNPCRVLIVDDNPEIVRATSVRLRSAGYETLLAYDGVEGVESALKNHPDVIIMDVKMPRMDGLTALAELQHCEQTKNIPVVMLSASVVDEKAALKGGARYFLRKPHEGRQLLEALHVLAPAHPNTREQT